MPKNNKKLILSIISSPAFIMLIISLVILSIQVIIIGKYRPFNSDDLYWQLAVKNWQPFSGDIFYFGAKDIFVFLSPFFMIMENLFNPSRRLLIAEALILVVTSFTLFYLSSLYFLKKTKGIITYTTLIPFVWLATFGYPIVVHYLNIDYRTLELGLGFATFALFAAVTLKDIKPLVNWRSRVLTLFVVGTNTVLAYSDPYYVFFILLPLGLFAVILQTVKKVDRKTALLLYVLIALSVFVSKILAIIGKEAGIYINTNAASVFVSFESIVSNILVSLHNIYYIFGADFLGREAGNIITLGLLLNAVTFTFIIYAMVRYKKIFALNSIKSASIEKLWAGFFILVMLLIFAVYTSSSLVDKGGYRFYLLFVWVAITYATLSLSKIRQPKLRYGFSTLIIMAIIFNLAYTFIGESTTGQPEVISNRKNQLNFAIIDSIKQLGLHKGYTNYWQANVNTYLSNNVITFLPTVCYKGHTTPFKWLINDSSYSRSADRTFYIIDPAVSDPPTCSQDQLIDQFGSPVRIIQVQGKSILVFPYDISNRF